MVNPYRQRAYLRRSHPSRGGWIEILTSVAQSQFEQRPTPHGVGGLKYPYMFGDPARKATSHPSRGGWIEIIKPEDYAEKLTSPTPHGVGGLK